MVWELKSRSKYKAPESHDAIQLLLNLEAVSPQMHFSKYIHTQWYLSEDILALMI